MHFAASWRPLGPLLLVACAARAPAPGGPAEDREPGGCAEAAALAAGPLVRLDHLALAELCQGLEPEEPGAVIARLRQERRLFLLPRAAAAALRAVPPRAGAAEDLYVASPAARERVAGAAGVRPFLGSGGKLAWLTFTVGIRGHYEVTGDALRGLAREGEPGFAELTEDAIGLVQAAAQDPDFFEWEEPPAHAQTGNDRQGRALPGDWQRRFATWARARFAAAVAAAAAGRPAAALYLLGYGLHAVEDLATHRGRSNAEHSYNHRFHRGRPDEPWQGDPDEDEEAIGHAEALARQVLRQLRPRFGLGWSAMARYRGPERLDEKTRQHLTGRRRDLTPQAIWAYRRLARAFADLGAPRAQMIRWCAPARCQGLLPALLP